MLKLRLEEKVRSLLKEQWHLATSIDEKYELREG